MRFDIATLFPEGIAPYLASSILARAQQEKLIEAKLWNIRDFSTDKHKTVDDTPYGGGAGMVMKIEPIDKTLQVVNQEVPREKQHVIVLAAAGTPFTQKKAQQLATSGKSLTFICGRYEGIDQRVIDNLADEAISIGPYVLAGGELPALVILEAVARLIPGVLGNEESLREESFSFAPPYEGGAPGEAGGRGEYPHYTRPEDYNGWKVPQVLLSGNHADIKKWRLGQSGSKINS